MFGDVATLMKRMGIKTRKLEALSVVIKTPEGELRISDPDVTVFEVKGQEVYQITGKTESGDIDLVCEKTGASPEEARKALEESGGDIAEAILRLTEKKV